MQYLDKFISSVLRVCGIIYFLFTALSLQAQNLSIQSQLDRAEIKTGEQAVVDVTIRTKDIEHTKFHIVEKPNEPARFLILSFGATDTIPIGDTHQEVRAKLLITSFDSTLITIPPIMAVSGADTALSAPLALSVIQPDVDIDHPEDFKDIKGLWEVSYTWRDILSLVLSSPWFWCVFVLLLLSITIYWAKKYWAHRPHTEIEPVVMPVPKPSAIEILEEKLSALEKATYHTQEDYKMLYTELVESLKHYLYDECSWSLQEMTTCQILEFLAVVNVAHSVRDSFSIFLAEADMSKFAKGKPSDADARSSIRRVREIAYNVRAIRSESNEEGRAEV